MLAGLLKGLKYGVAWLLASGAAVTLSWWGVQTVLAGTGYHPPRAVPIAADSGSPEDAEPLTSSTHRPRPSPEVTWYTHRPSPPPAPRKPAAHSRAPAPSGSPPGDVVRSYDTRGGQVVLDLGRTSASLVSATPRSGWSMQVWKATTWIRVDFRTGSEVVTLVCDWNQHPPQVRTVG